MTGPDNKDSSAKPTEPQLSAAELRNARRKARRMGLNPKNGVEAVKMLAEKGVKIDANEPSLIETASTSLEIAKTQPAKVPTEQAKKSNLPAVLSKKERQAEIDKLQARMTKKRNSRIRQMMRRFFMYVAFPTLATTYYLYNVATPLFTSKSILSIEEASSAAAGGISDIFKNSPIGGGNLDAIKVQNYLESRDLFLKLENDYDFPGKFSGDHINRFERLADDASEEDRYKIFKKYAISIYDTTDQVLRIEIKAPDPETTVEVAELMIGYAEDQLDLELTKVRGDELESARKAYETAELDLKIAQEKLIEIQSSQSTVSAVADTEVIIGIIGQQTVILNEKQIALDQLLLNQNPNQARVNALKNDIAAIEAKIEELNISALAENEAGESLAVVRQKMLVAEADVASKVTLLETQRSLLQAAEAKNIEQKKYITKAIPPTASFEPLYPKKLTTSMMAFVIFFGLYLFIAMTIDVIREQVSV